MNLYDVSASITFPIENNYKVFINEKKAYFESIIGENGIDYNLVTSFSDYSIHCDDSNKNSLVCTIGFNCKANSKFPIRHLLLDDQVSIGMKLQIPEDMQIMNPVDKKEKYSCYPSKDYICIYYTKKDVSDDEIVSVFEEKLSQIIKLVKQEKPQNFKLINSDISVNKENEKSMESIFSYEFYYDPNPDFIDLLLPNFPLSQMNIRKQQVNVF
ncbi:MAG: hypothetical protein D6B27_07215 [Gammaproteobacteria bacterium]|nr:MAG: hypothetical protein D6B27_07215 [Gammaproteobacteria bacterium]